MISFELFDEVINFLKKQRENEGKLNDVLDEICDDSLIYYTGKSEIMIIKMLNEWFDLKELDYIGTDLEYFIYELEFGDKWKEGCITEADGTEIKLSNNRELYDYLISLGGNK